MPVAWNTCASACTYTLVFANTYATATNAGAINITADAWRWATGEPAPNAEATCKAEELLRQHLNAEQLSMLESEDYFFVQTPDGRRFRIKRGFAGNVCEMGADGEPQRSFCIHPDERIPNADVMLAQKLHLETDLEGFLQVANVTELRG